jgi:hypothetical protein
MRNPLIKLVDEGRIANLEQLKSTYRLLVMKTHPDAVGSNRLLEGYLRLSSYFHEARQLLDARNADPRRAKQAVGENHRFAYYQLLDTLERIDKPYSFHRPQNAQRIRRLKDEAHAHFGAWNSCFTELCLAADREYDRLKSERSVGVSRQRPLVVAISPVFHNIVAYHLTGMEFHRKLVQQDLKAILRRLVAEGCPALKEFIELLIRDLGNGPAIFGEGRRIPLDVR